MVQILLISAHYTFFCSLLFVINYTPLPDKLSTEDRSLHLEVGATVTQIMIVPFASTYQSDAHNLEMLFEVGVHV